MKIAMCSPDETHGKVRDGQAALVTGTMGARLEQCRWAVKNGHTVYWLGACDDHVWEGITFLSDWRRGLLLHHPFDVAILQPGMSIPDNMARKRIVDCQYMKLPVAITDTAQLHADFQASYLANDGKVNPEKLYIVPNGYDPGVFYAEERPANKKKILLYTSSPDRGLHHVFPIVAKMRETIDCELHVFYDVAGWLDKAWWLMDDVALRARRVYEGMALPWLTYHGPVSRGELAAWYRKADLLVYPCDTIVPTEVYPTTVIESMACGCVPLLGACDSLPYLFGEVTPQLPLPIDYDQWAQAAIGLLSDDMGYRQKGLDFVKSLTWEKIAPLWEAEYA